MMIRMLLIASVGTWVAGFSTAIADEQEINASINQLAKRGIDFLAKHQADDGTLSSRAGSGITSLAITAALRHGRPLDDPFVAKGLKALEGFVQPDGGIYLGDRLRNYETCVAILCLSEANRVAGDQRYDQILQNAGKFLRGLQIGAAGSVDESDPKFGGVGYGGPERPDLSNTAYMIEALKALDANDNDPAIQRALVFISRCQNLDAKWNDTEFADKVNDGGFYYVIPTRSVTGSRSERYTPNGGLRSYGSMTYHGFKSLVYAGLTMDDPRTKAALNWIQNHYSLKDNPGQGSAGLFYYYNTFGKALEASQQDKIVTADSTNHDWRRDLITELSSRQREDGSWVNENRQWFENDANLCTSFALLALSHCKTTAPAAAE